MIRRGIEGCKGVSGGERGCGQACRVISAKDEILGFWGGRERKTKNVQITHSQNLGIWIPKTYKWLDLLASASPAARTTLCGTQDGKHRLPEPMALS